MSDKRRTNTVERNCFKYSYSFLTSERRSSMPSVLAGFSSALDLSMAAATVPMRDGPTMGAAAGTAEEEAEVGLGTRAEGLRREAGWARATCSLGRHEVSAGHEEGREEEEG